MITSTDFKDFLKDQGYSEFTQSGNPSTVYDYSKRVEEIREREGLENLDELANNIDKLVNKYDENGLERAFGEKSHRAYINALKRFQEFVEARNRGNICGN